MFFISIIACISCHNKQKQIPQKFDAEKWKLLDGRDFPYRDAMLDSLVYSYVLNGKPRYEVYRMLGEPSRVDKNYLFYQVAQQRLGAFVLHTKTLVIMLDSAGIVQMVKIHQ